MPSLQGPHAFAVTLHGRSRSGEAAKAWHPYYPYNVLLSKFSPSEGLTMGFFSGRVACSRYRVTGRSPRQFGPEHLERLAAHAIGKQRVASADGVEVGWVAGDHILDTRFDLAKNIV